MMQLRLVTVVAGGWVLGALGCAPGTVAQALRPEASTAAQALGEPEEAQCVDVPSNTRPLIVDWKPDNRGDLEVAMQDGIAVVSYSCEKLELLSDCHAEGSYGFKGVVVKQQMIRLSNEDELRMNLPSLGAALAASLKTELDRGATLDLATVLIGNRASTRRSVSRAELVGRCEGATHFVRGANVGAFAMQTAEAARAVAVAEIFSVGGEAKSKSSKLSRVLDGSLDSCLGATSSAGAPPDNCGALIRLHLVSIDEVSPGEQAAAQAPSPPPANEDEAECPQGTVLAGGKCARPTEQAPFVCRAGDAVECSLQCERGDARTCARLASIRAKEPGVAKTEVLSLYRKACEGGDGSGCSNMGLRLSTATPADDVGAVAAFRAGCELGNATGCFNLGTMHALGRGVAKDQARATDHFRQACEAGSPPACVNLGMAYDEGVGVEADPVRALRLFMRGCEGDEAKACTNLGFMYSNGRGTSADQRLALTSYEKACQLGSARSCFYAGNRVMEGKGTGADVARGKSLIAKACTMGDKEACSQQ